MSRQSVADDIKLWLKSALIEEELTEISLNVLGNTEKGDGYVGDVVFVNVKGKTSDYKAKNYDLVLKCSKKSQALRDAMPVRDVFENEIYLYSQVFPAFRQFQIEKNVKDVFDSVAKYYGKFISDNMEVIVLQNLKSLGYKLYDRRKALTLDHIKLVMREYGKWHAISGAMQDQQPEMFKQLADGTKDVWKGFSVNTDMYKLFGLPIKDVIDLVQDDVSDYVIKKLNHLKSQVIFITQELIYDLSSFSIITHGDCWNNNFMFKNDDALVDKPVKVAMLDWQISKLASPVIDLSYFLYACVSPEDLKNFDDILNEYHASFSNHIRKLGSDPEKIFPYSKLLEDWKIFSKFGVIMGMVVIKLAVSDKEEVQDIAEVLESGRDMSETFNYEIQDKSNWKKRVLGIIQHAVERDLI